MSVRCVGIDLGLRGQHKAVGVDEGGIVCGSLSFKTTADGLNRLEEFCTKDESIPTVVMEPTGLAWFPIATYLKSRYPAMVLVRAKQQKVSALRKVLSNHAKSDRIDALSLAKLPLVDSDNLHPLSIPTSDMQSLDRLTRRRDRLAASIGSRKTRIANLLLGYFPGLWECFNDSWNPRARWIYRNRLNPFRLSKLSPSQLRRAFKRITPHVSQEVMDTECDALRKASRELVSIYKSAVDTGLISDALIQTWEEEIILELDLIETEEAQITGMESKIKQLYHRLHPHDHLGSIPGAGATTAPVLLAAIGDVHRFSSAKAFRQWTGVVPSSHQSTSTQILGLGITKAGPARVKRALYQASEAARRYDPQLAALYYRQMVEYGKTHKQAMGAVMSHLASRIYTVLKEDRPYDLEDVDGRPITMGEGMQIIKERYKVPQEVRNMRRHHRYGKKAFAREERQRTRENGAAIAPHSGAAAISCPSQSNTLSPTLGS